jgi:hypothetical protein
MSRRRPLQVGKVVERVAATFAGYAGGSPASMEFR